MGKLKIDSSQSNFLLDGTRFFYLADTVWSAFTNITLEEWDYYLKKRREQGFNVLQINTMPQWDRCMSDTGLYPFAMDDNGVMDYSSWNDTYYKNARKMCCMAADYGFQLALVVLWLNYVPGTWGSRINPANIMPEEFVPVYAERIVKEFDEFQPIYIVSGDTDFKSEETVSYYHAAMDVLCEKSPDTLKTLHICRACDEIPKELLEHMDFYMFQSGHNKDGQDMAYLLPESFRSKYPKKPMVNAEPCYEQMGYSRQLYGRFDAEDIRKAAWSSILSGACAGVAYGAHGIWNWQKVNKPANPNIGEGFDEAHPVEEAMQFPGAWDYGWIRNFLKCYDFWEISDANELLANNTQEIRLGTVRGSYLAYLPRATKLFINQEISGCCAHAFDLATRHIAVLECKVQEGKTIISQHPFHQDALLVIEPQK